MASVSPHFDETTAVHEYLTNSTDLKEVAKAIRAKGGTSAPLVYPAGFVSAIQAITSGSAKEEQEKTVTITANGTVEITPDAGKTLSKANAVVNVHTSGGGGRTLNPNELYTEIVSKGTQVSLPTGATGLYVETGRTYVGAWIAIKGENGATAILYVPFNGQTSAFGYDTISLDSVSLWSGPVIENSWRIITEMDGGTSDVTASEAVIEVHYLLV